MTLQVLVEAATVKYIRGSCARSWADWFCWDANQGWGSQALSLYQERAYQWPRRLRNFIQVEPGKELSKDVECSATQNTRAHSWCSRVSLAISETRASSGCPATASQQCRQLPGSLPAALQLQDASIRSAQYSALFDSESAIRAGRIIATCMAAVLWLGLPVLRMWWSENQRTAAS